MCESARVYVLLRQTKSVKKRKNKNQKNVKKNNVNFFKNI